MDRTLDEPSRSSFLRVCALRDLANLVLDDRDHVGGHDAAQRAHGPVEESVEGEEARKRDADQDRKGDRDRDQGAALGQNSEEWLGLSHPARSQREQAQHHISGKRPQAGGYFP